MPADRPDPDQLSWRISPDNVLPAVRSHYETDGDTWYFEQWNGELDEWIEYDGPQLRLTVIRAETDE